MKKSINTESVLERLSILRSFLLDNERIQREGGNHRLADNTHAQAQGISLAMEAVRKESLTRDY